MKARKVLRLGRNAPIAATLTIHGHWKRCRWKRCYCPSVHPLAIIGIFRFVRIDISPLAVEVHVPVMLPHVDLELARGPAPLPAVVLVAQAVDSFACDKAEASSARPLRVNKPHQSAGQVNHQRQDAASTK